jgi:catechol 2,3-dioxygenase-like lactoylglutathione lyase family enzyme
MDFEVCSSIPVLRMLDENKAREFYIDYLGYEVDWEHRFGDDPDSDLYMQIHFGDSVLHLNGHATNDSPVCEVRVPVINILKYCEYLLGKTATFEKPEVVDPRYEGKPTDMNIYDPFGNLIVFWAREATA